jgi:hypothetical protein
MLQAGLLTRIHLFHLPDQLISGIEKKAFKDAYSCGYSPGFTPDSLFIPFAKKKPKAWQI